MSVIGYCEKCRERFEVVLEYKRYLELMAGAKATSSEQVVVTGWCVTCTAVLPPGR